MTLVLSLFPGIGLLDMAFEEEGFCVVRGPDLLWGGNIKRFHPPAGKFDGVIGGSPCQPFTSFAGLIKATRGYLAENLIPEFERVIREVSPAWFVHENVRRAPILSVTGYTIQAALFDARWIGEEQSRLHQMTFGSRLEFQAFRWPGCLDAQTVTFENAAWSPRVLANGGYRPSLGTGGAVEPARKKQAKRMRDIGYATRRYVEEAKRLQGLPPDFDLPGFTIKEKCRVLGDAVPLPMGRAVARAVKEAIS